MRELFRYEAIIKCFEFLIEPILECKIPEEKREAYKLKVIKGLEEYVFIPRGKNESPHPETMLLKKGKKIIWNDLNYDKPEDVVKAIITILHPYYVSETQNRIKKRLEENLKSL